MSTEKWYLVMWDCYGIEYFTDITEYHPDTQIKQNLFQAIKTNDTKICKKPVPFNVNHLVLRAQSNPQRHYEIYVFTSHGDVPEVDIRNWFEGNPQSFVDWVRQHHTQCLYSNRADYQQVKIV